MSIATQITRLQNIKAAIRQALVNKGVTSASTHDMEDFATDIGSIPTGGTYQSKTVSPSTSQQVVVTPDSGYDALSQVTIRQVTLQSKTVTPTSSNQDIWCDSGYWGLRSVTVLATTPPVLKFYLPWFSNNFQSYPLFVFKYNDLATKGYNKIIFENVESGYEVESSKGANPLDSTGWNTKQANRAYDLSDMIDSTHNYFYLMLTPVIGSTSPNSYCTVRIYKS
jgi:hypothetical protein